MYGRGGSKFTCTENIFASLHVLAPAHENNYNIISDLHMYMRIYNNNYYTYIYTRFFAL